MIFRESYDPILDKYFLEFHSLKVKYAYLNDRKVFIINYFIFIYFLIRLLASLKINYEIKFLYLCINLSFGLNFNIN